MVKTRNYKLVLTLINVQGKPADKIVAGIYLGRFSQMLISHFDEDIETINLS